MASPNTQAVSIAGHGPAEPEQLEDTSLLGRPGVAESQRDIAGETGGVIYDQQVVLSASCGSTPRASASLSVVRNWALPPASNRTIVV